MRATIFLLAFVTFLAAGALGSGVVFAQEGETSLCPPGISVHFPVRGINLESTTTTVSLDLSLCNGYDEAREVSFAFSGAPQGWTVAVRPSAGLYTITDLMLGPGMGEALQVRIRGPMDDSAANFVATLRILLDDGTLVSEEQITVRRAQGQPAEPGQVKVTSTYPFLSGPSTSKFEFELSVINNTAKDVSLDLGVLFPQEWSVTFTPAFGEEKLITNVSIAAGLNQRIKVKVVPNRVAAAGDYPIRVRVANEDLQAEIPLQVTITGNFDLAMGTPDGRLNVDADAGDTSTAYLRLFNSGTADIENMGLFSDAPAGWEIKFEPGVVEKLPSNNLIDIPLKITPPGNSVPGDYLITLRALHPNIQSSLTLRITVTKSTVWQWVGIGILVAVIGALVGMFLKLGRR